MSSKRDYYEILGVGRSATQDEIKKAYRKLAKQYHPDTQTGDEAKFKEVTEAYETLNNSTKRGHYDRFGHGFEGANASGQDFSDIFSDMFHSGGGIGDIFSDLFGGNRSSRSSSTMQNRPMKGETIQLHIDLTLKEYIFGKQILKTIKLFHKCDDCKGSGAQSESDIVKCDNCNGHGIVNEIKRTMIGVIQSQTTCGKCRGQGKKILNVCKKCRSNKVLIKETDISFKIPASFPLEDRIALKEKGHTGLNNGPNGDIIIDLSVREDSEFKIVNRYDLYLEFPVSYLDLILGANIDVPTFDGIKKLKIQPNTANNSKVIISNCGLFKSSLRRGDLIVQLIAYIPKKILPLEKKLLSQLRETSNIVINTDKFKR